MSAVNFGVEWNAGPDLESALKIEQEKLDKNPQQKDGRKLTPAQIRDSTFAAIAKAIDESDFELASEILSNNPNLAFLMGSFSLIQNSLLENFNRPLAQKLNARGLSLNGYEMYQQLEKRHDPEMLAYLIEQCKTQDNAGLLEGLFYNTLKGFTATISDLRRQELRDQRGVLEDAYPDLFAKSLQHEKFFPVFLNYTTLPECERNKIFSLSQADWNTPFSNWFKSFPNYTSPHTPTVGLKTLKNILSFLNDFPFAQNGWNTAVENLKAKNQEHKDFIAKYFKTNETFENSELYKIIMEFQRPIYHNYYRDVKAPYSGNELIGKLGLTSFEMQQLGATDWDFQELTEKDGAAPPFEKIPEYVFPSFVHVLVKTASQASLALLQSEQGQRLYADALQEPAVLKNWCVRATPEMINTVVRACPTLLEWTDNHNNTLAHYLVVLRVESSKTFGQLMARLNHNWLLHENDQGVSLKDLFKHLGANEDMLNTLDKEAIKRSVKDAGIKKTRRTDPSPKRRM